MEASHWLGCGSFSLAGLWRLLIGWVVARQEENLFGLYGKLPQVVVRESPPFVASQLHMELGFLYSSSHLLDTGRWESARVEGPRPWVWPCPVALLPEEGPRSFPDLLPSLVDPALHFVPLPLPWGGPSLGAGQAQACVAEGRYRLGAWARVTEALGPRVEPASCPCAQLCTQTCPVLSAVEGGAFSRARGAGGV